MNFFVEQIAPDYDIICFQECYNSLSSVKSQLITKCADIGFGFMATAKDPLLHQVALCDGGLLVVSRFAIVESEFCPFKYGLFIDGAGEQGFIYCLVEVRGEYIMLFNTHLNSSGARRDHEHMEAYLDLREMMFAHLRDAINLKLDRFEH